MLICKQEKPEKKLATAFLLSQAPALPAAADNEGDEAQWEAYLAELLLRTDGECVDGCDWTDGALCSEGCHW